MRLNIDALQELYNTLLYGPVLSSPYADSPIDRAFKECDDKLSGSATFKLIKDIQNRCDNLERSNKALRDDNDKVSDKAIELAKKNERLEKDLDICKRSNEMLLASSMESISEKRKLENEIEDLKKDLDAKTKENSALVSANADLSDRNAKLQRNFDRINHLWTGQIQENMELRSKIVDLKREKEELESQDDEISKLKKDLDDAKNQLAYFTLSRDNWRSRAKHAEDDVEDLKKKLDAKSKESSALIFTNAKLDKDLKDSWQNNDGWRSRALEAEKRVGELLLKKYDQAFEDLRKERDRYSGLYTELKKDYDRLFEENRSLKEKVVDLKKRIKELQKKGDDLTKKGEDLKKRLNSVYGTVTCGPDYFYKDGMYDLWSKMREVVDSTYSERLGCFTDLCDIEDLLEWDLEDFLNEYNEWQKKKEKKERDFDRCEMKNPTFYFDNHPVKMGCTLEATVEVDKDLLNTVLGIKPKEEEHKLDYGDAVRVPWRNYDYMYIGPEGKHIRLFDPKTHAVVLVSVTDNLTYQGCKIILCDEDDIRKIWKDKK